jgi:hypothetical protein
LKENQQKQENVYEVYVNVWGSLYKNNCWHVSMVGFWL